MQFLALKKSFSFSEEIKIFIIISTSSFTNFSLRLNLPLVLCLERVIKKNDLYFGSFSKLISSAFSSEVKLTPGPILNILLLRNLNLYFFLLLSYLYRSLYP